MARQLNSPEAYTTAPMRCSSRVDKMIDNLAILNRDFIGGNQPNSVLTQEGVTILLVKGSIADQTTDAIVNSVGANFDLNQGALSKTILEKAGPKIQEELKSQRPKTLRYGDVTTTKGFHLSANFVFHGVLKQWNSGKDDAEDVLRGFVRNCLDEAGKRRLKSISIPAVGTGILGFPSKDVVEYLFNEADNFSQANPNTSINEIRLVVYEKDQKTYDCFEAKLNEVKPNDDRDEKNVAVEYFNDLGSDDDDDDDEEEDEDEEENQLNISAHLKKLNIEAKDVAASFRQTGNGFPSTWQSATSDKPYEISLLNSSDDEYKQVSKGVMTTKGLADVTSIVKIERIENRMLYQLYIVHKNNMERMYGIDTDSERFLWHGTAKASIDNICSGGFNRSYCGKNAVVYGRGVYFARDFQYSAQRKYSEPDETGTKYVFLCKVLTGTFQIGRQDMVEPEMRPGKSFRYDSTVDRANDPSIFVIYKDAQAYPAYLVSFK